MQFNFSEILNFNKSSIIVPEFLKERQIKDSDVDYLKECFDYLKISSFSELNIDILNKYAKFDYDKALKVNTLLGLYGVNFIGRSSKKYSPNSHNVTLLIKLKVVDIDFYKLKLFKEKFKYLEFLFLNYFDSIGLNNLIQIDGMNLSVLLDKLNLSDININDLKDDINSNFISIINANLDDFYKENFETEINISDGNKEKSASLNDFDNLSTKAKNCLMRFGIYNFEQLLDIDFYNFAQQKNVGKKTVEEIEQILSKYSNKYKKYNLESLSDDFLDNSRQASENKPIDERIYNLNIESLKLPPKIIKILIKANISTLGELVSSVNTLKLTYDNKAKCDF